MSRKAETPEDRKEKLLQRRLNVHKISSDEKLWEKLNDKYGILPLYVNVYKDRFLDKSPLFPLDEEVADTIEDISEITHFIDDGFIGMSPNMFRVFNHVKVCADCASPVLIMGETGTGKELAAKLIHKRSKRGKNEFMAISCTGIPETLLESELFGVIANYPGLHNTKALIGKVEAASGGTLFLDEIGDMPPTLQAKVLRFLNDGTYFRLGETKERKSDTRIIAATNRRIDRARFREECQFRNDLYYRLNTMTIVIPPLRQRLIDIPLLTYFFIEEYNRNHPEKIFEGMQGFTLYWLLMYDWRGNVRELKSAVENLGSYGATSGGLFGSYLEYCVPDEYDKFSKKFLDEYLKEKYRDLRLIRKGQPFFSVSELLEFDIYRFFTKMEGHFKPEQRGKWKYKLGRLWPAKDEEPYEPQMERGGFTGKHKDSEAQFWRRLMAKYPEANVSQLARIAEVSWDKTKRATDKFSRKSGIYLGNREFSDEFLDLTQ